MSCVTSNSVNVIGGKRGVAEKVFEDVDELFEEWTSLTKTIGMKIPQFLEKIEEKKIVFSPRFKLSGVEFCIKVIKLMYVIIVCFKVELICDHMAFSASCVV